MSITKALYGKNQTYIDVTDKVNTLIINRQPLPIDNSIFGDPLLGIPKEIIIHLNNGMVQCFPEFSTICGLYDERDQVITFHNHIGHNLCIITQISDLSDNVLSLINIGIPKILLVSKSQWTSCPKINCRYTTIIPLHDATESPSSVNDHLSITLMKHVFSLSLPSYQQYLWIDMELCTLFAEQHTLDDLYQIEYQKTKLIRIPKINDAYLDHRFYGGPRNLLSQLDNNVVWDHVDLFEIYSAHDELSILRNYKNNLVFRIPLNPPYRIDGIGNKFKSFIGSLSINTNTKFATSKELRYSDFGSIFPPEYLFDDHVGTNYVDYYTWCFPVLRREELEQKQLVTEYCYDPCPMGELEYLFSKTRIDLYYDHTLVCDNVKTRLSNVIKNLRFLPNLYDRVSQFTGMLTTPILAIGIRTWKAFHEVNINRPYDPSVYINKINDVLQKHPQVKQLFITIDNDQYLSEYYSYLKTLNRSIFFYNWDQSLTDLENATIQMLVSSKCQYVIGSRTSTFTELIYWFSDFQSTIYTVY